jgi:hypothetical protein
MASFLKLPQQRLGRAAQMLRTTFSALTIAAALGGSAFMPAAASAQDRDHDWRHDDHRVYDWNHRDYHSWNRDEDRYYRAYLNEHRYRYRAFSHMNKKRQREYWRWRHEHGYR